ncbi:hypothetical protein PR202_gb04633 [Eleusine coracana subsp. coracana]|uniref:Pectinesterase catalytic domain-containing protein n=1 Tax=Eleusine coracana subsp. coracana TaxID=191504 RepID=A0AAV5E4L3_ELECO|nr:hypothetical protein PR202_gb04633 [Eleusine coracana subsp. coracana]
MPRWLRHAGLTARRDGAALWRRSARRGGAHSHSTIMRRQQLAGGSERFTIHVRERCSRQRIHRPRTHHREHGGPDGKKQAVALLSNSSNHSVVFFRCEIKGYQDTLLAENHLQFYRDCWVPWDKNVVNITTTRTVFYGEYKNEGPGSDLRHRVSWPGFHKMKHAAQARKYTVDAFIHGGDWLPEIGVAYKPGL